MLFALALLVPVFSGLGFVAMARELATGTTVYPAAPNAAERAIVTGLRDSLVAGWAITVVLVFMARAARGAIERRRNRLVTMDFPGRQVRVPRGWTVLEASRGFGLPHASLCGGRARCSTCRVRVLGGLAKCPAAGADEQATLARIAAPDDVRLACQLRPSGDVVVAPLVPAGPRVDLRDPSPEAGEGEVALLLVDLSAVVEALQDHPPQDALHVIRLAREALSFVAHEHGSRPTGFGSAAIVLVFDRSPDIAANARTGLAAALEVERAMACLIGSLADTGARRSLPLLCLAGGVVAQWRGDGSDSILAGAPVNVLTAMQAGRVAGTPPLRVTEELLRAAGRTGDDGILLAVPVGRASVAVRAFASASALDPGDAGASIRPAAA